MFCDCLSWWKSVWGVLGENMGCLRNRQQCNRCAEKLSISKLFSFFSITFSSVALPFLNPLSVLWNHDLCLSITITTSTFHSASIFSFLLHPFHVTLVLLQHLACHYIGLVAILSLKCCPSVPPPNRITQHLMSHGTANHFLAHSFSLARMNLPTKTHSRLQLLM